MSSHQRHGSQGRNSPFVADDLEFASIIQPEMVITASRYQPEDGGKRNVRRSTRASITPTNKRRAHG